MKEVLQLSLTLKITIFLEKLNNLGISLENDNLFLRRVLYKNGKSKAFISDTPVTVGLLQKIGSDLVEIHGQNEKDWTFRSRISH